MPRKLIRKSGHAVRGSRTLCGKPAPRVAAGGRVTCRTCALILSANPVYA